MLVNSSNELSVTSEQIATNAENAVSESVTIATAGEQMTATSHKISQSCHHAAENSRYTSSLAQS
ncbi:hypothetical protein [Citrifermentans bemidjiense]|uniref:hypothetical protein n=1 Tax=Citrifermentans bemidjiense TaxID=225194 RepID=UPI0011D0EDB0|nr:hypothetical protein [Citrifermentans bemidjiense]